MRSHSCQCLAKITFVSSPQCIIIISDECQSDSFAFTITVEDEYDGYYVSRVSDIARMLDALCTSSL